MSKQIISLIGWRFLPDLVTGWIQSIYYAIVTRSSKPRPITGSIEYNRDRRRIYVAVVTIYLLFTIYEVDWEIRQEGHFFQILKLPETATEREIKTRFRRLAALHHPDKVSGNLPSAEPFFVKLKLAQDTLLDPVKRFAYERFGPAILKWERCTSMRDYIFHGFYSILPSHCVSIFVMYVLECLGYVKIGNFWRWLVFGCFCVFEMHMISSPYISPVLIRIINPILTKLTNHPPLLPFQLILLGQNIYFKLYLALSQLGPFFQQIDNDESESKVKKTLDDFEINVKTTVAEVNKILNLEMTPFFQESRTLDILKERLKEWLVQNTIRMDPEVRDAISRSLQERNLTVKKLNDN